MNITKILQPLGEKIGDLTSLVQDMKDNLDAQTELSQKIFQQLIGVNEKLTDIIDALNEKNICKTKEVSK